jgi:signal transduction histidine kinase
MLDADSTAERLTMAELRRVFAGALRVRWFVVVMLTIFGALFALFEPSVVRVAAPWTLAALLAFVGRVDARRLRGGAFDRRAVLKVAVTLLGSQALLIGITGGIRSPFVVLTPPVLVLSALGTGQLRLYVPAALAFVGYIWALAIGDLLHLWSPLLPRVLGGGPDAWAHPVYAVTLAVLLTLVAIIGGGMGLSVRRGFDRATTAAVGARAEAVDAMRARNRELVELSGALAHELKNPLAAIRGLAGVIGRRLEPGSREAEQMGVLIGEVGRMAAVLDEFLNFSRPAAGLAARDVDPGALVEEVALVHEPVADERGVRLVRAAGARSALRADPRKIKQVLVNLVQNALDASPAGGEVRLTTADRDGGGVEFEVCDDGPGLADEVRGRLFTPGATTKAAGSGLGLTIARAIAEQHGGGLDLEARPEGGCRARLWLPASPAGGEP